MSDVLSPEDVARLRRLAGVDSVGLDPDEEMQLIDSHEDLREQVEVQRALRRRLEDQLDSYSETELRRLRAENERLREALENADFGADDASHVRAVVAEALASPEEEKGD